MVANTNRRWVMLARPRMGSFCRDDFRLEESRVPSLEEGEFLVQTTLLSFDPAQRVWMERDTYMPKIPLGSVVRALGTGKVVASRNPEYPVDTRVVSLLGWQDFAVCTGKDETRCMKLADGIPDEAALSAFGITGLTGYFGMTEIGKPLPGDSVVVSGASGATGSIAAQVAKNLGATVIGIAGGREKCQWLLHKAKLDAAIDYKNEDVSNRLKALAPKGINVYFDNVGGTILDTVLSQIARNARVVLCGAISTYDGTQKGAISNYMYMISQRVRMEGFIVTDYENRFLEGIGALVEMFQAGKLQYEVDVQHGLENALSTLQRLFDGKNLGKQLLRL